MRLFLLLVFIFFSFSCAAQKREIIAKSTIKLEGKNTHIRDLIEIDGYYYTLEDPESNCRMFFEDGTWVSFSFKRDVFENEIKANISGTVTSRVKDNQVIWGDFWGVYKIVKDTIIVHRYMKGNFWVGWSLDEEKYKIIDRKTILKLNFRGLLKNDTYIEANDRINEEYHFVSADSLPSPECWLKEEKWIWRNESDWKAYMDRIKLIKQKSK